MTRRKFLNSSLGGMVAALPYPCYFEPRWVAVVRRPVRFARVPLPEPVRLLHLSDLHFSWTVPLHMIEAAVTLGLREHPDVICLTGDFITGREDIGSGAYAGVLSRLAAVAPTFAVLGNHDGGLWAGSRGGYSDHLAVRQVLAQSGIQLLHNRSIRVQIRSAALALCGVGDIWAEEMEPEAAFAGVSADIPVVLLSHNPDSKDMLARWTWDLLLSGHTHGGQVILPFDGPRFAPVLDKRYVSGLGAWGSRQIHVSPGVGNVGGVRFRCRPEVNLLTVG